jgi:hypothetical protein
LSPLGVVVTLSQSNEPQDEAFMTTERDALKRQYGKLYSAISDVLFKADPMGIRSGASGQSQPVTLRATC